MGEQKSLLCFVFLCVIGASVDAMLGEEDGTDSIGHCAHEINHQVGTDSLWRLLSYIVKSLSCFSYILFEAFVWSPARSKWSKREKGKWTTVPTIQNLHPL